MMQDAGYRMPRFQWDPPKADKFPLRSNELWLRIPHNKIIAMQILIMLI